MLAGGGNAVDAAVAGAFAAFVAEPLLASAGGAGMMTIALPDRAPAVIDFFSTMPGLGGRPGSLDFLSVELDFGTTTQTFHIGRGSAAPPVALPGLLEAAGRFGTRALGDLVAPAIVLADEGVALSREGAEVFRLLWPIQSRSAGAIALAGGTPPMEGSVLRNPELAALLAELAELGETPPRFERAVLEGFGPARGGLLSREDLRAAAPRITAPREARLGEWTVLLSPHIGGTKIERIVRALTAREPERAEDDEALRVAEACRLASAQGEVAGRGSTTHISVIDAAGGAAALTLTNGEGSGHVAADTGVQLNNFLGEDDINPDGFHRHEPGAVLPTMIAPTIGLREGRPVLALGSGGSNRIRSVVSQVLYRMILGEPVEQAVLAPRVHAEADDVWLERVEWKDSAAVERKLSGAFAHVHSFPSRAFYFGGVHAVAIDEAGDTHAAGDPRRGGAVAFA